MANTPSYWTFAARAEPSTTKMLQPSPLFFRPERSEAMGDGEAIVNAVAPLQTGTASTGLRGNNNSAIDSKTDSSEVPFSVPKKGHEPHVHPKQQSSFLAPQPSTLDFKSERSTVEPQRVNANTSTNTYHPIRLPEVTQVRRGSELTLPASQSDSTSMGVGGGDFHERPAPAAMIKEVIDESEGNEQQTQMLHPSHSSSQTSEASGKIEIRSRGELSNEQEALPWLTPSAVQADARNTVHADWMSRLNPRSERGQRLDAEVGDDPNLAVADPDRRSKMELEEKTDLRIGSIVVHLEPPASPPVAHPARPGSPSIAARPSGSLARGFSSFGFHQT